MSDEQKPRMWWIVFGSHPDDDQKETYKRYVGTEKPKTLPHETAVAVVECEKTVLMEQFYRKMLEEIWNLSKSNETDHKKLYARALSVAHDALMIGNVAEDEPLLKEVIEAAKRKLGK